MDSDDTNFRRCLAGALRTRCQEIGKKYVALIEDIYTCMWVDIERRKISAILNEEHSIVLSTVEINAMDRYFHARNMGGLPGTLRPRGVLRDVDQTGRVEFLVGSKPSASNSTALWDLKAVLGLMRAINSVAPDARLDVQDVLLLRGESPESLMHC